MNSITKILHKGKKYNLRATRARYWDIAAERTLNNTAVENFTFTPYEGLEYLVKQPIVGTYTLTISAGQLPNLKTIDTKYLILAPTGTDYFYMPQDDFLHWTSVEITHADYLGYVSQGVMAEGDVPTAQTYNLFINSEQKFLLSTQESLNGYLWCGTVHMPAHTQNVQYKVNFDSAGSIRYLKFKAVFSAGCYLKARRQTENDFAIGGGHYRITVRAYKNDVSGMKYLVKTPNGAIGCYENHWMIKNGENRYSGGIVEASTWYWVRVIYDGEGLRLYYLDEDDQVYTADTLPALTEWTQGVYMPGADFMGTGDFYISAPAEDVAWEGRVDLSSISVETVAENNDGTETATLVWEALTKVDVLSENA